MAEKKNSKQEMTKNESSIPNETKQAESFRKKSFAFGVIMFVFMAAGIVASIVTGNYICILFVFLGVMCINLVWFAVMSAHRKKAISLEIKKTVVVMQFVNGRWRTVNKKNIKAIEKHGKSLVFVLQEDEKLRTVSDVQYINCTGDDINEKVFPYSDVR